MKNASESLTLWMKNSLLRLIQIKKNMRHKLLFTSILNNSNPNSTTAFLDIGTNRADIHSLQSN
jgi:hypothetical protein